MQPRIDVGTAAPGAKSALGSLLVYVRKSGLEPSLVDLVNLRVSILEGCAYCIDAHTKDARARGETEQRLYAVAAWEETPFFTDRERAALAWTDTVTRISETHIPDEAFSQAREYFSEKELVDLTMAIIAINGWNRLATSFRMVPGSYQPAEVERRLMDIKTTAEAQP
jgi:AhpD family alkylhydroperoxidase